MNFEKVRSHLILLLAILLGLGGSAYLSKGFYVAWREGDSDLRIREREWSDFKRGTYPNLRFTPEGRSPAKTHSVYPPYALSMYSAFFGLGGFILARVILQALCLAALAVMVWQGYHTLHAWGWRAALLGAALGPAISGNCSAIALGQFSILSAGLLSLQVLAMKANGSVVAGICWAFAMIKPHIALPFALLFIFQRQWRGLFSGAAILIFLSGAAFCWTGWSAGDFVREFLYTEGLYFIHGTGWIDWIHLPPRVAMGIGLLLIVAAGLAVLSYDWRAKVSLLGGAGLCAMLGFVLLYHRQYDNQMLFPLMLAIVLRTLQNGYRLIDVLMCCLLGAVLYLPAGIIAGNSFLAFLALAAPVMAGVWALFPLNRISPQTAIVDK